MAEKRAGRSNARKNKRAPIGQKARETTQKYRERIRRVRLVRRIVFSAIVLAVAGVIILLVVAGRSSSMSGAENVMGSILTRLQQGVTSVSQSVKDYVATWRDYSELEEEYGQLSRDYQALSVQYSAVEELRQENARLTNLLGASQTYSEYDPVFARVVARDPGVWFDIYTIDLGSSDGIAPGMAVLTADGLAGRVTDVGYNYSKVMSIIDARSSVAVLMQTTRDNGIMKGQIADGTGSSSCYVYYLPDMNSISPGDTVVTSGTDSQYPKGIVVGTVSAVSINQDSAGTYAIVKPGVDFQHLEEVLVLKTVVESESEQLPTVITPAPAAPTSTPAPDATATPLPTGDGNWYYPTATPRPAATGPITDMLEDQWAED